MMNRNERIATVIAAVAVIALIGAFIWVVMSRIAGDMESTTYINMCITLTSVLTFVVMIYAVYIMRGSESAVTKYEEYSLRRKEEEEARGKGKP